MGIMDTLGDVLDEGKDLASKGVDVVQDNPISLAAIPVIGPAILVGSKGVDAVQSVQENGFYGSFQKGMSSLNTTLNRSNPGRNSKDAGHLLKDGLEDVLHGDIKNGLLQMLAAVGDKVGYGIFGKFGADGNTKGDGSNMIRDSILGMMSPEQTPQVDSTKTNQVGM